MHIASGLVLLLAFRRAKTAKPVAIGFGVVYGIVTIIGLIDGNDVVGLIPINAADNVLHLGLSALGILAGLISRGHDRDDERSGVRTSRSARVVERDSRVDRVERTGEVTGRRVETGRPVDREVDRDEHSSLRDDPRR